MHRFVWRVIWSVYAVEILRVASPIFGVSRKCFAATSHGFVSKKSLSRSSATPATLPAVLDSFRVQLTQSTYRASDTYPTSFRQRTTRCKSFHPKSRNRNYFILWVHRDDCVDRAMSAPVETRVVETLNICLQNFQSQDELLGRRRHVLIPAAVNVLKSFGNMTCPLTAQTISLELCELAIHQAHHLCQLNPDPTRKRKKSWQEMQAYCQSILCEGPPLEEDVLAITVIFGALAISDDQGAKAAASALSTTILQQWTPNKIPQSPVSENARKLLKSFFLKPASIRHVDWSWNVVTQFSRGFSITQTQDFDNLVAVVTRQELQRANSFAENWAERKPIVSGILSLVCQLHPWSAELPPLELVEAAVPLDFWHSAEQVCLSHPAPQAAVEYLIDASMDDHTYRRADQLATSLYDKGGRSRFLQARYHHACDTIAKVIFKRQLPIIERQVVRMDQSVERIQQDQDEKDETDQEIIDFSKDIRLFALAKLEEAGEPDAAHRLATIWGMDYFYDENVIMAAAQARREKYLQFDQVISGEVPDLISDHHELRKAFETFWKHGSYPNGPFGLDAEWEAGVKGVDLLQLAHPKEAILIDIPALVANAEGVEALKATVGKLFDSTDTVVTGFACRQDLSRLRQDGWLAGAQAVIDIQPLVVQQVPELAAVSGGIGLARVCNHFFGKPLDKAEQCSFWAARPLSVRQRSYAALDAWVCAAVYEKMIASK